MTAPRFPGRVKKIYIYIYIFFDKCIRNKSYINKNCGNEIKIKNYPVSRGHGSNPVRGTQRMFSVKYLFGEANIA